MTGWRMVPLLATAMLAVTACRADTQSAGAGGAPDPATAGDVAAAPALVTDPAATTATTDPPATDPPAPTATTEPPATDAPAATPTGSTTTSTTSTTSTISTSSSTSTSTSSSTSTSTSTSTTTTTTIPLPDDVFDPDCVMRVQPGDSLGLIAERFDDQTVTAASIAAENSIADPDLINAGALLDVCVGNGLDDVLGAQRADPDETPVDDERTLAVKEQQIKLNELFAGYGIRELLVDGISGPVTRQRLCAFRVARGLPVSRADMEVGTIEHAALMFATELTAPQSSAFGSERWGLIDLTCQIMFVGSGSELAFVFPTSTGEEGYETRPQDRSRAFRYDPAAANGGWHNSTTFPVAIDNPLNGNMYRPIYFDGGQAIHGSNNVPTTPQSKGCARLRVGDQDALVNWLGLGGLTSPSWSTGQINFRVNVQGAYQPG